MSLLSKLFGIGKRNDSAAPVNDQPEVSPAPPPPAPKPEASSSDQGVLRLTQLGQPAGPDPVEAQRLLHQLLGGPRERDAIEALNAAARRSPLPEALRVPCALALVGRGEREQALCFLNDVSSVAALMLKADLLHEAGQVARSVSVIERVLARDIDTPGARERHERWRGRLAPRPSAPQGRDDVTVAVPAVQQSPFRILREVARGGAGTIYEARDDALTRSIALKVYHRAQADHDQMQREALLPSRLAGPGIVQLFDIDFEMGWIAIEWAASGSLRDLLSRGEVASLFPLSSWLPALAAALARVHAHGWVHADIKPANVLMRSLTQPVLTDFGIAVPAGETSLGGSAGFLSPERLQGDRIVPADDIYGFGRLIEEILVKAGGPDTDPRHHWLAERCMGPLEARPKDGEDLLRVLAGLADGSASLAPGP